MTDQQRDLVDLFESLPFDDVVAAVNRFLVPHGRKIVVRDPALDCLEYCDRLDARLRRIEGLLAG